MDGLRWPDSDDDALEELFPLLGCWEAAFRSLTETLRQMVRQRDLAPSEMAALAKLIYAVDRLPNPTTGVAIEASLSRSHQHGRISIVLCHYGTSIELSYSESFYEPRGTEHILTTVLEAEVGAGHNREDHDPITVMLELENWVEQWSRCMADLEYEFEIIDSWDPMDWEQPARHLGWGALPSGV